MDRHPNCRRILSSIINIILDYVFVRYMKWEVDGAANATLIAQIIAYVGIILYANKRGSNNILT